MDVYDDIASAMIGHRWDASESDAYFNDLEEHPLFADEVPDEVS